MYQIKAFAQLTHTTPRTLRYYHELGLLVPQIAANGYREYRHADVDRLQRILMLRELGFELAAIRQLLEVPTAELVAALQAQQVVLTTQQAQLQQTQARLAATLDNLQGGSHMSDEEKFAAFKDDALRENDAQFGQEVTAKYGATEKAQVAAHWAHLPQVDYQQMQAAEVDLKGALREYLAAPALPGQAANAAFVAHQRWLQLAAPNYSLAMHRGIGQLYQADERFGNYYAELVGDHRAAAALSAIIAEYAKA